MQFVKRFDLNWEEKSIYLFFIFLASFQWGFMTWKFCKNIWNKELIVNSLTPHFKNFFFESIQAEMILMFLLLFPKILNMGFEKLLRLTDEPKSQINFKSCQKKKLDSNFIWIWGNEIVIDPTMSINIFIFLKGLETFFNLIYLHHPPLVFILLDLNLIDQY